ncbi:sulfotransferase family protein [Caulobacter sp. AP07]|uniref:tetratricopeptide repeat-containing sulfotransferase family protein n=1 Tax=Caulobacter sp. AP07 TaxID=1144304 RepID=UPI0002721138|nr:tetratricopeptide repeat-containing sulfotransferase family protein [Caulobacter sp. AP07]EJL31821.1 sulfotransferase family protein [Caulobacter sp. AP07]
MQSQTTEPSGSLATALAHAQRLLAVDPRLAAEQARAILEAVPRHAGATLMLAAALRLSDELEPALAVVDPLARALVNAPEVQLEHGLILARLGRTQAAIAAFKRAVALEPTLAEAWRGLAEGLELVGDEAGAQAAQAQRIRAGVHDPALMAAASALVDNRLGPAEQILRDYLAAKPAEPAAIRMLAEVVARLGRHDDAEALLVRCLKLAPGFTAARHNLATVVYRQGRSEEALVHLDQLLAGEPRNPAYANLKAAALARIGEYAQAIGLYEDVLARYPRQPKGWMSYGHALKTVGRSVDCVAAYRKAVDQAPALGEAWWSLANMKTYRFSDADLAAMEGQLARADLEDEDRFHLHYALGKAHEDAARYAESFAHYDRGAALRRAQIAYDPETISRHVARSRATLTAELFAARAGQGCPAPDPVFILGLPRSGSTLIEQILASHSAVEGTMELPDITSMARRLGGAGTTKDPSAYPEILATLSPEDLKALGEEFLERTRVQRKTGRPFFIDKMPNNFAHIGLIALALPNAKIIDARRHPMGCCFSGFKQHFARGQNFSYGLADIGRYYADYVALMAHYDAVLPGRVHRVIYESMVADPEREIRALLDYCGLPFEASCLNFHENDRAVRTASSEQVRQPIFKDAVEHWQHYEPWLEPLKTALGPVLSAYPAAPEF